MKIEFDPDKNQRNIEKHGFSLDAFHLFDFDKGIFAQDTRRIYGEQRFQVIAPLKRRLCIAVFTMRDEIYRVISLRKTNRRERRNYENQKI